MTKLIKAAKRIRELRNKQKERVTKIQELAKLARETGIPQTDKLKEFDRNITVIDFGDAIDELCEALEEMGI